MFQIKVLEQPWPTGQNRLFIERIVTFEIKTHEIKKEYQVSNKIIRDLIKHTFAFNIDNKLIPTKLSKIQQDFYDALNS